MALMKPSASRAKETAILIACLVAGLGLMLYGWVGLNHLTAVAIVASHRELYQDASFTVGKIVESTGRRSFPTYAPASIGGQEYRYTLGWEKGKRHWYGNRDWEVHRGETLLVSVRKYPQSMGYFAHSLDIVPRDVHANPMPHLLLAILKVVGPMAVGLLLIRQMLKRSKGC